MPTEVGHWTYTTFSNDYKLDGVSGEFDCVPSSRPGILIVNPDYPYTFKLSEGEPFFWMGETNWCIMSNAVPFEDSTFHKYVNKRREQQFNGIHFVLGTGGLPRGTDNPQNEGGYLWFSQENQEINPDFFVWVDKRIAYMDSVEMAIGFFFTWAQHFTTFKKDDFERFERYMIARYAAYPRLYWVVVGEFDEDGLIEDYNYHGQVIDNRDPYGHPISNHPGHNDPENSGSSRIFADQDWFSFIMQQYPQYPVITPVEEVNHYCLADRKYNIPVVNVEFGYEESDYYGNICTADYVRKYAWAVVTGGGFFSYGHDETIREVNFDALETDGIEYMGYLFNFFKEINWWEMNPDTEKVDNGFCLAGSAPEYIIYLPDGGTVNLDLTADSITFNAKWYNPVDGTYGDESTREGGTIQSYTSNYSDDAVLHVFPNSDPYIYAEPESLNFEASEGGTNPSDQGIVVTNTGGSTLSWQAWEEPDEAWMNLSNTSGGSGEEVVVSFAISNLTEGRYEGKVRISDPNAVNDPVDVPATLNITAPSTHITVLTPNGGEILESNTSYEITWSSYNTTGSVNLYYSVDNGISWKDIVYHTPDDGHYLWNVPEDPSIECLVRVTDIDVDPFDDSDTVFVIIDDRSDITGTVLYYNEHRPVENTILDMLQVEGSSYDTTDSNGFYFFESISDGDVKLTPSKHYDGEEAISGSDALVVLQHLAFMVNVTPDQQFVADVNEDGNITGSDAQAILRYLAYYIDNIGCTGQWRFDPDTSKFLFHADTTIGFKAFLMGDVNGDWGEGSGDGRTIGSGKKADTLHAVLKMSEVNAFAKREISIPLIVAELSDTMHTLVVSIEYDPKILRYRMTRSTALTDKFMMAANGNQPGKVHIAMAGLNGVWKNGEIIRLFFTANKLTSQNLSTDVSIKRAWINDQPITNYDYTRIYFDEKVCTDINDEFIISQNYPNPFNPTTTISFNLPYKAHVKIRVFNTLGQMITTLINRDLEIGSHEITWQAIDEFNEIFPSGIYFYRMEIKENSGENGRSFNVMKKMFLLK